MRMLPVVLATLLVASTGCAEPLVHMPVARAPALPKSANDGTAAQHGPIVILVTIDGLPARALRDPELPMPTLRRMERNGAWADAMQPINPTITWPNHTTLTTGVNASAHHVMANGLIHFPANGDKPTIKQWVNGDVLVSTPTLYDVLAARGMSTGQVDWVAIYGARTVQWPFAEIPDPDGAIAHDLESQKLVTREELASFSSGNPAWRDEIWTDAAVDIIEHHTPNLLLVHLLQTDTLQHEYGALSPAAYAAYAYADACLTRLVSAARRAGILARTTFIVASDHGFADYTHAIHPNAVLAGMDLLRAHAGHYHGKVWAVPDGGEALIFIHDTPHRAALASRIARRFTTIPGVEDVYTNAQARVLGIPTLRSTSQAPNVYLTAKKGYAFQSGITGPVISKVQPPRGAHGYPNTDPDMQAIFVASGFHIRHGVDLGDISNLSVAPTIAQLLGVILPHAAQAPLEHAIKRWP